MKIAVLAAMDKELSLIESAMGHGVKDKIGDVEVTIGKIAGHEVIASRCGIGKVNSALRAAKVIETFHPEMVINSGVAGGADLSMKIGTVLVADRAAYHDVWCGPGTEYGQADGCPLYFGMHPEVLKIAEEENSDIVRTGLICTGDKFISTEDEIREIKSKFPDALAVDMESASIAHSCLMHGVPAAIIRVVSDTPGSGDNISQYKNFWSEAPEKSFTVLRQIISRLK